MLHSCGSVASLIPAFVEAGVAILDPIQTTAAGMDPSWLKQGFGDVLCFHGGVDTQYLLPQGTPDDVRREVRRLIDVLGRGGGYIFCASQWLQPDVPLDNILAMYDEALCHQPR
jgi:uroporphyrinogen decarboxylase